MATTVTMQKKMGVIPSAPVRLVRFKFAADNSYPSGGEALLLEGRTGFSDIGGTGHKPEAVLFEGSNNVAYTAFYDRANDKIVVLNNGTEVANATDLSGKEFYFLAIYE